MGGYFSALRDTRINFKQEHYYPGNDKETDGTTVPAEKSLSSGKWQSGNVAKVLNNKTVKEWLARQVERKAA